jgi:hypothetical protein
MYCYYITKLYSNYINIHTRYKKRQILRQWPIISPERSIKASTHNSLSFELVSKVNCNMIPYKCTKIASVDLHM